MYDGFLRSILYTEETYLNLITVTGGQFTWYRGDSDIQNSPLQFEFILGIFVAKKQS